MSTKKKVQRFSPGEVMRKKREREKERKATQTESLEIWWFGFGLLFPCRVC